MVCIVLLLLSVFFQQGLPGEATLGVDLSAPASVSNFTCLKKNGYESVKVRAYRSDGTPDPNVKATIANARAAGFSNIDVYMIPCPRCPKSSSQEVADMVTALAIENVSYSQIWLHIEGPQYWIGFEYNQRFFNEMSYIASTYATTGVYTNVSQWSAIMGSNYSGGSSYQLWYPHYDSNQSFSDFKSFGGWSKPTIKQFEGDKSECGVVIGRDFY